MPSNFHSSNARQNSAVYRFNEDVIRVLASFRLQPHFIVDSGVDRTVKDSTPFGDGCIIMGMGDHNRGETTEGFNLSFLSDNFVEFDHQPTYLGEQV